MTRDELLRHPKLVEWRGCPLEAGTGWDGLVQRMLTNLDRAGLDVTIGIVKEKFGQMAVQVIEGPDAAHACPRGSFRRDPLCRACRVLGITEATETASSFVCEQCGTTRDVTTGGQSWIKTLCATCRARRP